MDTLELPVVETRRVTWYHADDARRRPAPQDRPPASGRVFVGVLGFGAMLTTAALLLSDRAPGVLDTVFGDRARRLWARIDGAERVGQGVGAQVASTDFVVHLAMWAVVTVLVGMAIWTWRGLTIAVLALGGASLFLELAQGRYATTRTVQASDAFANLIGISLGAVVVSGCFLVWSMGATLLRRLRPGDRANLNGPHPGSLR